MSLISELTTALLAYQHGYGYGDVGKEGKDRKYYPQHLKVPTVARALGLRSSYQDTILSDANTGAFRAGGLDRI
jgi:hypothetical protein